MPDLRIKTARENGDLPKEKKFKNFTLEDAINPDVIKAYYKQFKKEFGVPSIFDKGQRSEKT